MRVMSAAEAAVLARLRDRALEPEQALGALFDHLRPRAGEHDASSATRYAALLDAIEGDHDASAGCRQHVLALLGGCRLVGFFSDSGILPATGFFTEASRLVAARLLPEVGDESDLRVRLARIFHARGDWRWVANLPADLGLRFWRLVHEGSEEASRADDLRVLRSVRDQMLEALLLLAWRLGGLDVEHEFGRLGTEFAGYAARFRGLASAAQRFVDAQRARLVDPQAPVLDAAEIDVLLDQCADALARARRASVRMGTSVRLSYLLLRTEQSLERIDALARLLDVDDSRGESERLAMIEGWARLVRAAIVAEGRRHSVRAHVSDGMSILALRVSENAARTGEHYIAESRPAYYAMWRAAMGAGLIIGVMALLKIYTAKLGAPPAAEAILYSLNYGLGFVLIFMLHLTVATKQPAMTAQTMAAYLRDMREGRHEDVARVADLVVAVARTQSAAILGNVVVALPTAVLVFHAVVASTGHSPLDAGKAAHLLHDLDINGWAIPHAALAGVFLFLSGVLTGYFDNKATYARLAIRIGALRWLRRLTGPSRAARVGEYVEGHLGGLLGNFLFGCMLGTAGTIGLILGLPIDIRHIAFAAANLGYALSAFDFALPWRAVAWAALGVAAIGATNLVVSFLLALWMALRARRAARPEERSGWRAPAVAREVLRRFVRSPASFFTARGLPPAERTGTVTN
jgi:site-specific recombinase